MAKEKAEKAVVPSIKGKSKDGKEVNYRIKEIKNGFVVTQCLEWTDKKGIFQHESQEFFVKEDPIKEESENMFKIIEGAVNDTEF